MMCPDVGKRRLVKPSRLVNGETRVGRRHADPAPPEASSPAHVLGHVRRGRLNWRSKVPHCRKKKAKRALLRNKTVSSFFLIEKSSRLGVFHLKEAQLAFRMPTANGDPHHDERFEAIQIDRTENFGAVFQQGSKRFRSGLRCALDRRQPCVKGFGLSQDLRSGHGGFRKDRGRSPIRTNCELGHGPAKPQRTIGPHHISEFRTPTTIGTGDHFAVASLVDTTVRGLPFGFPMRRERVVMSRQHQMQTEIAAVSASRISVSSVMGSTIAIWHAWARGIPCRVNIAA
ncbi:hypothetical protein D9M70_454300 [compost metagenome]